MSKNRKIMLCAEFMVRCLSYGWKKSDLDQLQKIWWDHKGWQHSKEFRCIGSAKQHLNP